jgi:RimJ/RimL family protein N-acetyltransferase
MNASQLPGTVIVTQRLQLIVATVELLSLEFEPGDEFSRAAGAKRPSNWPPALYDRGAAEYTIARLLESPADWMWWMRYIVLNHGATERTVIGTVGFKGPPDEDGVVEVGYGLLRQFQKQGYATEAVAGMVAWAFGHPAVRSVRAQTLPKHEASIGVMQRNGLSFLCESVDDGLQTVLYEVRRKDWGSRDR